MPERGGLLPERALLAAVARHDELRLADRTGQDLDRPEEHRLAALRFERRHGADHGNPLADPRRQEVVELQIHARRHQAQHLARNPAAVDEPLAHEFAQRNHARGAAPDARDLAAVAVQRIRREDHRRAHGPEEAAPRKVQPGPVDVDHFRFRAAQEFAERPRADETGPAPAQRAPGRHRKRQSPFGDLQRAWKCRRGTRRTPARRVRRGSPAC